MFGTSQNVNVFRLMPCCPPESDSGSRFKKVWIKRVVQVISYLIDVLSRGIKLLLYDFNLSEFLCRNCNNFNQFDRGRIYFTCFTLLSSLFGSLPVNPFLTICDFLSTSSHLNSVKMNLSVIECVCEKPAVQMIAKQ